MLLAVPFGRRSLAQVSRLHAVAEALDDVSEALSSQPTKRKRKKRRKKMLPRISSLRSSCAVSGFFWETASRLSFFSVLGSAVDACGFWTSFTHPLREGGAHDSGHFFLRAPCLWQSLSGGLMRQLLDAFGRISLTSYVLFHRYGQVFLQLRAARSLSMQLPLVSASLVVPTSGRSTYGCLPLVWHCT